MSRVVGFPKERASMGDTFRCRKCRVLLFSFDELSIFHEKVEPVDQCSAWYISSDVLDGDGQLSWIKRPINEAQWTEGKVYCPKCTCRIGAFNFIQGVHCSCHTLVIPAIWIQKGKVDQVSPTDAKPDIRLPGNPHNPGKYSAGTCSIGKSAMLYMGTSPSGTGFGQACPKSGQSCSSGADQNKQSTEKNEQCVLNGTEIQRNDRQQTYNSLYKGCRSQRSRTLDGLQTCETDTTDIQPVTTHSDMQCLSSTNIHYPFYSSPDHLPKSKVYKRRNMVSEELKTETIDVIGILDDEGHGKEIQTQTTDSVFRDDQVPEHLTCAICLDLLYEPLACHCDHVFCDPCLRLLNSRSHHTVPRCPLCRKHLHYVYPAVELREEIRNAHPSLYRERHKTERRAPHRRLPLPSGRMKPRQKRTTRCPDVPMPYGVLVFLVCVLAVCVLCLVILFVFCPPLTNRCVTVSNWL